jgi:V-type H+-transporting ATPase subunit E
MSDSQVGVELRKMTEFIKREAQEKAEEIEIKARQDFEKDKSALILQEKAVIDAAYEKKFKQASMSLQITRSKANSKARITILTETQAIVDKIFDEAEKKLEEGTKNKDKYRETLKNLALEGFYAFNDPSVQVRARKKDVDLVKEALELAAKEYKDNIGKDVDAEVDESKPLPDDSAGGIVILSKGGKIVMDNTLDTRLELLKESSLPAVRETLFGENTNRKFYD